MTECNGTRDIYGRKLGRRGNRVEISVGVTYFCTRCGKRATELVRETEGVSGVLLGAAGRVRLRMDSSECHTSLKLRPYQTLCVKGLDRTRSTESMPAGGLHRRQDLRQLCRVRPTSVDPCCGMVMSLTSYPEAFLKAAEELDPNAYGQHGLNTCIAAHNDNCIVSPVDHRSTCLRTWAEYNDLLGADPS